MRYGRLGTLCLFLIGMVVSGGAPVAMAVPLDWLRWPVACVLGQDCYVPRYVDHDPASPGIRDFRCRFLTGDSHTGTDIAVQDLQAMEAGVSVLAAAAGRVIDTRDRVPDQIVTAATRGAIQHIACGNNIAIQHENGYISRYCHLQKGSIRHDVGDRVQVGERIGSIGLSGDTNFPHVHFTVQRGSTFFDPFTAAPMGSACVPDAQPPAQDMWIENQAYRTSGVIKAVMYAGPQQNRLAVINHVQHQPTLPTSVRQLQIMYVFYGMQQGYQVMRSLQLPDGRLLSVAPHVYDSVKYRSTLTLSYGKKNGATLPPGEYKAIFRAKDAAGKQLWQYEAMTTIVE